MPEPTRCPECGAPLVPGDRFCPECGASVDAAVAAEAPAPAPMPMAAAAPAPGWPSGSAAGQGWSGPLAAPAPGPAVLPTIPATATAMATDEAPPRSDAGWFATTRPSTMFGLAVMVLLAALLLGAVGQVDPTDTLVLLAEFVGLFGLALLAAAIVRAIAGLVTRG